MIFYNTKHLLISTTIAAVFGVVVVLAKSMSSSSNIQPIDLTISNWTQVLEGEWLIEFYAPWCPSCRSYAPIWEEFARKCPKHVKVARANVDDSPELSGRLLIVALPTIYHVKDGDFRHHEGSRNIEELLRHVNENLFIEIYEPLSWIWYPQSPHMVILGFLFRIAVEVRNLQMYLTNSIGLPSWLSYVVLLFILLIIAIAIGFVVVVCFDRICYRNSDPECDHMPPRSPTPTSEDECDDDEDYGYRRRRRRNKKQYSSEEASTSETDDDEDYESGEVRKRRNLAEDA